MTSTLKTNTIEPEGATTNLVIGESGQNTVISNNDLRANVLQDAGGNAVFTSNGSGVLSGVNSGFGSAMVLLSTQTASGSASISFTSGIDSTYGEYIFKYINIHPATNGAEFNLEFSTDGGSSYGLTKTTTFFYAYHNENGSEALLVNVPSRGMAQSTNAQDLAVNMRSAGASNSGSGELHLFNPASTTYAKQFQHKFQHMYTTPSSMVTHVGGYINTTTAVDAVRFTMSTGNIDYGIFKMWGVK